MREGKANQLPYQATVRTVLGSLYTHHYRRMLPALLGALRIRSNNAACRPVTGVHWSCSHGTPRSTA